MNIIVYFHQEQDRFVMKRPQVTHFSPNTPMLWLSCIHTIPN